MIGPYLDFLSRVDRASCSKLKIHLSQPKNHWKNVFFDVRIITVSSANVYKVEDDQAQASLCVCWY